MFIPNSRLAHRLSYCRFLAQESMYTLSLPNLHSKSRNCPSCQNNKRLNASCTECEGPKIRPCTDRRVNIFIGYSSKRVSNVPSHTEAVYTGILRHYKTTLPTLHCWIAPLQQSQKITVSYPVRVKDCRKLATAIAMIVR